MKKLRSYYPYIIFAAAAAALIIRSFYGFCQSDEPFYISTAQRLFQGDRIFVDEWFPTQLSAVILLPFYAAYVSFTGGTAGIILYFRLLYIIISLVIACDAYMIIDRDYSKPAAICISLFMMFYAHLNIASMSYYTMSFEFYIFSMLLISMKTRRGYISGGFFFALAVLSLPSLAVGYAIVLVILLCFSLRYRRLLPGILYSAIGICAAALLFIIYLYSSGNSLVNLFDYLPYILEDEEHQTALVAPFKKFFTSVTDVYWYIPYLTLLLAVAAFFSSRFKKIRPYIFILDACTFIWYFFMSLGHTGYINTAFALFALPLFCMNSRKDWYAFSSLFIGGLAVSMTYSYSSNGELYVMTIGHGIACVAAVLFLDEFIRENPRSAGNLCMAFAAVFIMQTCILRFVNVYRDAPLSELDTRISSGPAYGLFTTSSHARQYGCTLAAINSHDTGSGYVFFTKLLPWGYLAADDMRCGASTTWRTRLDSRRLDEYYSLHADKIPSLIFVMDENVGAYDTCGDIEADPSPNQNESGGWLGNYISDHDYSVSRSDCCTVYSLP